MSDQKERRLEGRKSHVPEALLVLFVFVFLCLYAFFVGAATAQEARVREGFGSICDTVKQAEQLLAIFTGEKQETWVEGCGLARVRVKDIHIVKEIVIGGREYAIVQIEIVAIEVVPGSGMWFPVIPPQSQFSHQSIERPRGTKGEAGI